MTVLFISGFETEDFKEWSSTSGTPSVTRSASKRSGDCYASGDGNDYCRWDRGTNTPDCAISFAKYIPSTVSVAGTIMIARNSSDTTRVGVRVNSSGYLELVVPSGGAGSVDIRDDAYHLIDVVINYVDGSNDTIDVYLDDESTPSISWTGALGGNDIQKWDVAFPWTGITSRIDDVRIDDVATKIGDHKIVRADVIADDSGYPWAVNDYTYVDDWASSTDDDTTTEAELHASAADEGRMDLDEIAALSIASGDTINALKMCCVMKRDGGGGTTHFMNLIDDGSTKRPSGDLDPGTGHVFYSFMEDGAMPTPTNFDAYQFGPEKGSGGQKWIGTAMAVMVDYSPAGVSDFPLDCTPGTYALTGDVDTAGFLGAMLNAGPSSYALTGDPDTAPLAGRAINAAPDSYTVSGVAATLLRDAMINAAPDGYAITGIAASLLRGLFLDGAPGAYVITGIDAEPLVGRGINASPATYTITGVDAELLRGLLVNAAPGTYAITGVDAILAKGFAFIVDSGTYSISGVETTQLLGRVLNGGPGAYSLSGIVANLARGLFLDVAPGAYAITGIDATLAFGYVIVASSGSYLVIGADAELLRGLFVNAEPGSYTKTGVDASLLRGAVASVDPGGYSITGQSATLNFGFVLVTDVGAYVVTGIDASPLLGRFINAETTTYSITGVNGSLVSGRVIQLDVGSYIITGVDANLLGPSLFLDAGPGVYALSGIAATVLADQLLSANPGNYLVSGVAATLLRGYNVAIDPGAYAITGVNGILLATRMIVANPGFYLTGGPDFITDGQDMGDTNWIDTGGPTTNEQTDHDGQVDCRHIVSGVLYGGVSSSPDYTVVHGDLHRISFRLKVISGSTGPRIENGDGTGSTLLDTLSPSVWTDYTYEYSQNLSGTRGQVRFIQENAGSSEFYVDKVVIEKVIEASLVAGRVVDAAPTTYSITGIDGSLVVGRVLSADPDSYLLTGQDASLLTGRVLSADNGSYALTGQNASILIGRALSADPSSYSVVGQSASLAVGYLIVTDVGSYLLTGPDATLVVDRMLNGGAGVYSITGIDATLQGPLAADFPLNLEPGVYALTGDLGALLADRLVTAAPGTYVVVGEDAVLERVYIGALVVHYRSSPLTTIMTGNAPFDLFYRDKPKKVPA